MKERTLEQLKGKVRHFATQRGLQPQEVILMTILELRQKTGLSQSQFAKRFHLNVRTVQTWEQGTRKTPDYVIWLITKVIELEEIVNAKRDGI